MSFDPHDLASRIKQKARLLGFDLAGIASAEPSRYRAHFERWLAEGRHGTMHYMERRLQERTDPASYLPGAKSVICVALNYHTPLEPPAGEAPRGRIARYALGRDYHEHLKDRLYDLADWLRDLVPGTRTRCATDTAPVLERELAERAGIGWIGKNACVLNERMGSWLLLGEVLTTLELPHDEPADDHCGTCTRCIDACPTGALIGPRQLDARRCISYLTIEHTDEIDPSLRPLMGDWIFGCDICQDVCPFNQKAPVSDDAQVRPRVPGRLDLADLLSWRQEDFSRTFSHSAVKRIKLPVLKRNAQIALENSGGMK
jgi:epoxyqueuosine reductase